MKLFASLLICTLMLGACTQPSGTGRLAAPPAARDDSPLPTLDQLKSHADQLLSQMASKNYKQREEATKQLRKLLKKSVKAKLALAEYAEKRLGELNDPELSHRLEQTIDALLRPWKHWVILRSIDYEGVGAPTTFSSDGKFLLCFGSNGTWHILDTQTWKHLRGLKGHETDRVLTEAEFSPDGKLLVTSSRDCTIRMWNPQTGKLIRTIRSQYVEVFSFAFSPDGKLLASGHKDNEIWIWRSDSGEYVRTLKGHKGFVIGLIWHPDSEQLISASYDGTIRTWDVDTGKCLRIIPNKTLIKVIALSSDGSLLASGHGDDKVKIWDAKSGKCLHTLQPKNEHTLSWVSFSPTHKVIACGYRGELEIWDPYMGYYLHTVKGISHVLFSSDGRVIVTAGDNRSVDIWGIAEDSEEEDKEEEKSK